MGAGRRGPLLLASRSPRRAELLAAAGIPFEVGPPVDVSEDLPLGPDGAPLAPGDAVRHLARRKAAAAAPLAPGRLVLAADTLVFLGGQALGKPADAATAVRMLRALSGREHLVATGVALAGPGREPAVGHDETRVRFRALTEAEIDGYVGTGESFDKAGGYGIQGAAGAFVASLDGAEDTVIGLPVALVGRFMALWDDADKVSSAG